MIDASPKLLEVSVRNYRFEFILPTVRPVSISGIPLSALCTKLRFGEHTLPGLWKKVLHCTGGDNIKHIPDRGGQQVILCVLVGITNPDRRTDCGTMDKGIGYPREDARLAQNGRSVIQMELLHPLLSGSKSRKDV
jgi:hypothetical protein